MGMGNSWLLFFYLCGRDNKRRKYQTMKYMRWIWYQAITQLKLPATKHCYWSINVHWDQWEVQLKSLHWFTTPHCPWLSCCWGACLFICVILPLKAGTFLHRLSLELEKWLADEVCVDSSPRLTKWVRVLVLCVRAFSQWNKEGRLSDLTATAVKYTPTDQS